jgi:hypothetical protein
MAMDKKNDEKVQDLPKTKIDADKAEQVKGGQTVSKPQTKDKW